MRTRSFTPFGFLPTAHFPNSAALAFKGERWDALSGNYLLGNGYRAYNPRLMRFHSPDSESPFGLGGPNCYAFSNGDPINWNDPSGHVRQRPILPPATYTGPVTHVGNIVTYSTQSPWKRGASMNHLRAHGTAMSVDGKTPLQLVQTLQQAGVDLMGSPAHLIACNSATPTKGLPTYGQELANIIQAPVIAYEGYVASTQHLIPASQPPAFVEVHSVDPSRTPASRMLFNYRPVIFHPRRPGLAELPPATISQVRRS